MYSWRPSSSTTPPARIAAIVATWALLASAGTAHASALDCEHAIVKATAKYAHVRAKTLQRCRDRGVADRMVQPCSDSAMSVKLAIAAFKLRMAVVKRCAGSDHFCGTFDDQPLSSIGWDGGACPDFEAASCTNAIADCDDIATCLECVGTRVVDQVLALYYDAFDLSGNDTNVVRCQRALGKKSAVLFKGMTKILRKCETKVLAGIAAGPCPEGIATGKLNRLADKYRLFTCKACGGDDKTCNGVEDQQPGDFGASTECPDVQIPGGAACGGPITDLTDLVNCVLCVTQFKATCLDALTVPQLKSYPPECQAAP